MAQATITITVLKVGSVWKAVVVDKKQQYSNPKVDPADIVEWQPNGTDVTITFPEPNVFLEPGLFVNSGQTESLIVKNGALSNPNGYPYSVFCHEEGVYAEGAAAPPPVIIVPRTTPVFQTPQPTPKGSVTGQP